MDQMSEVGLWEKTDSPMQDKMRVEYLLGHIKIKGGYGKRYFYRLFNLDRNVKTRAFYGKK
jgi:hypothetical protein